MSCYVATLACKVLPLSLHLPYLMGLGPPGMGPIMNLAGTTTLTKSNMPVMLFLSDCTYWRYSVKRDQRSALKRLEAPQGCKPDLINRLRQYTRPITCLHSHMHASTFCPNLFVCLSLPTLLICYAKGKRLLCNSHLVSGTVCLAMWLASDPIAAWSDAHHVRHLAMHVGQAMQDEVGLLPNCWLGFCLFNLSTSATASHTIDSRFFAPW